MTGPKSIIPFNGVDRQYKTIREEILHEIDLVLMTGNLLNGPKIIEFEKQMARQCGRTHAVAVNSGSNAIHYILDIIKYKYNNSKDMNIAAPVFTFPRIKDIFGQYGYVTDVDVDTYTGLMDLKKIPVDVSLDVLIYTNLFGNMIDPSELETIKLFLKNPNLKIIEDAAQSFGASYNGRPSGSFGDFSVLSFDPTKNLPNYGGGGMILCDDEPDSLDLAEKVLGYTSRPVNSRMSEVDCAGMLVKLKYFNKWQKRRKQIAKYYDENIKKPVITPQQVLTPGVSPSWQKYVIQCDRRYRMKDYLKDNGIETKVHYDFQLGSQYPGAVQISSKVLSLPMYADLTDSEVEYIVETINHKV